MASPRPRRQRKGDRLLSPNTRKEEIQCDYGVAPFDRLANEMDHKWGIDRLPELVSPETAAKFGTAIAQLNAALEANDPQLTAHKAQVCIRGLHAMDAEATKLGRKPASGKYIEGELDGWKFGIMLDDAEWQTAQDERPDLKFFTIREAAIALRTKMDTGPIAEIKKAFPGAQVVSHRDSEHRRTPLEEVLNDTIPF